MAMDLLYAAGKRIRRLVVNGSVNLLNDPSYKVRLEGESVGVDRLVSAQHGLGRRGGCRRHPGIV
eukprot:scaffold440077_cov32-Prasinocladus_malaysianus.AAC.1